ncbi:hypothetical protein DsansV1_C29g0207751 [Dioscorea sansibarensis]
MNFFLFIKYVGLLSERGYRYCRLLRTIYLYRSPPGHTPLQEKKGFAITDNLLEKMAALVGVGSVILAMKNCSFFKGHSTKDESGSGDTLLKKKGERKVEVEKREKGSALAPRFAQELDGLHCFETLIVH